MAGRGKALRNTPPVRRAEPSLMIERAGPVPAIAGGPWGMTRTGSVRAAPTSGTITPVTRPVGRKSGRPRGFSRALPADDGNNRRAGVWALRFEIPGRVHRGIPTMLLRPESTAELPRHCARQIRSTAMDDEDLAGLIEQAKAGDEAALRDLLSRFEEEVRMVVRARLPRAPAFPVRLDGLRPGGLAERLHGPRSGTRAIRQRRQFRGFLAGVARNKVFEEHRRPDPDPEIRPRPARSRSTSAGGIATYPARCRRPSPRRARTPRPATGSTR